MRRLASLSLLLVSTALPLWADTIEARSRVLSITVYPQGAQVTREVVFDAAAGAHEVLITDLPAETDPQLLRIAVGDGLALGAYALRSDRLPPRAEILSAAQATAKAEVERLEQAEREAQAAVNAVTARIEAAEAQVGFLRGVGGALTETATPESLQAMSRMIGAEVLAAREQGLVASKDLWPAQMALADVQDDLAMARAGLEAALGADTDYTALQVALTMAAAGEGRLTVTHFVQSAAWRPVYDMRLTRQGEDSLTVARGVLVSQSSGEDWAGVDLTLSTAQPSQQAEPTPLWPDLRRIAPEEEPMARMAADGMIEAEAMGGLAEPAMAPEVVAAAPELQGDVVVYRYPTPVDIADGVEEVRLALDEVSLAPVVQAYAVPRFDKTAFVMAEFTNSTEEILLPGNAYLYREGVLVGGAWIDSIAPGAEARLAFGAIEGLRLLRDMPTRIEGDSGMIVTSNQIEETAVLKIENLTDEAWPVRLLDQVPYSEQEDLEVSLTSDPPASETDVDGKRGVLAWDLDLAPGETREVTMTHSLSWPDGMILQ